MKWIVLLGVIANLMGPSYSSDTTGEIGIYESQLPNKLQQMSREERLADAVAYYTEQSFFKGAEKDLYQRADRALKESWREGSDPFEPADPLGYFPYADLYLLQLDTQRVWMEDLEADVGKGNGVYAETLKRWSEISNGVFTPTNIVEKWQTDEGPVTVEFEWKGKRLTLTAEYYNDFFDLEILDQLNEIIESTGYQFAYLTIDQTAFVTCLTDEQRTQWEADRGLSFFNE
ncbi:hypothetical protein [Brevibacillus nitrificans]|uniref:hypothetical protein n=1 Tax=Brevibacillus nitrificans TaxID=651560 RepID=UPI00285AE5C6|nr:hypothetical protein [Brevibacillus nitrificans]MDR7318246.1 hypothetical protein [Brevibacillus nitrificans]